MKKINLNKEKKISLNKGKKLKCFIMSPVFILIYICFMVWSSTYLPARFLAIEFIVPFLCLGINLVIDNFRKSGSIIILISGLLIGFILAYPYIPESVKDFIFVVIVPRMMTLFFIWLSFIVGFAPIIKKYKQKKRCTIAIESTIIKVKKDIDDGVTVYCPVYRFVYNEKSREYCPEIYSNMEKYVVGDNKILFVNPKDEEDIYIEKGIKEYIFRLVFSILLLGFLVLNLF